MIGCARAAKSTHGRLTNDRKPASATVHHDSPTPLLPASLCARLDAFSLCYSCHCLNRHRRQYRPSRQPRLRYLLAVLHDRCVRARTYRRKVFGVAVTGMRTREFPSALMSPVSEVKLRCACDAASILPRRYCAAMLPGQSVTIAESQRTVACPCGGVPSRSARCAVLRSRASTSLLHRDRCCAHCRPPSGAGRRAVFESFTEEPSRSKREHARRLETRIGMGLSE